MKEKRYYLKIRKFGAHSLSTVLTICCLFTTSPVQAGKGECERFVEAKGTKTDSAKRLLPGKRLALADPASQVKWAEISRYYQEETKKRIEENLGVFLAAKKAGNTQISYLESLGIVFEPEVFVPELFPLMDRIEQPILDNIAAGELDFEEAVWPRLTFALVHGDKNDLLALDAGASFTSKELDQIDIKMATIANTKDFLQIVHSDGYPFGNPNPVGGAPDPLTGLSKTSGASEFLHDIGHMGGLRNPVYMKSAHRLLSDLRSKDMDKYSRQIFLILETLCVVKKFDSVIKHLGLKDLVAQDSNPSIKKIMNYMDKKEIWRGEISQNSRYLRDHFEDSFYVLGGSARDLFTTDALDLMYPLHNYLQRAYTNLDPRAYATFAFLVINMRDKGISKYIKFILDSKDDDERIYGP